MAEAKDERRGSGTVDRLGAGTSGLESARSAQGSDRELRERFREEEKASQNNDTRHYLKG